MLTARVGWIALVLVCGAGLLLGGACDGTAAGDDDSGDDSLDPTPARCEEGYRHDPDLPESLLDDFPGGCVPQACGVGRWGEIEGGTDVVFVDANAAEGGDGAQDTPFTNIQSAIDTAAERGSPVVAVAAGTYNEILRLAAASDGMHLAGRCPELVVLDASGGGQDDPGIKVGSLVSAGKEWFVSGLTVTGGRHAGVWLDGGRLSLADVSVAGNHEYGIWAWGAAGDLMLSNVSVTDTQPLSDGTLGRGLHVQSGSTLLAEDCLVARNTDIGVFVGAEGAAAILDNVEVRETAQRADGSRGRGIEIQSSASLLATDCLVEANADIGIVVGHEGTTAHLYNVTVRNTKPREDGGGGRGIEVNLGAFLSAEGVVVEGNADVGVMVGDDGTEARLTGVDVLDTRLEADGTGGRGVSVQGTASLTAENCRIEGNAEAGLFVSSGTAHLVNVVVSQTTGMADGTRGRGVEVQEGAFLQAVSCTIEGNADVGLLVTTGSAVLLTDVDVTSTRQEAGGTGGRGASVQQGSSLTAEGCRFENNGDVGILATSGSTVLLTNVEVRDTMTEADGTSGRGIGAQEGSLLLADDCLIEANSEVGVLASDIGTEVHLSDLEIRRTQRASNTTVAVGLVSQRGAVVTATDLVVEQTEGLGVAAVDQGALSCVDCAVTDSSFAGILAWGGGRIDLTDVTCTGTSPDANEGGGIGIYMSARFGPSTLLVADSTFEDHPYAAVWLDGDGSYTIGNSTLVGGYGEELVYPDGTTLLLHGDGVVAIDGVTSWDGTSGLKLEGNEIRGSVRAGVLLDASSAQLTDNSFNDNDTDLIWQDCAGVDEPNGLDEVPVVDYCPVYDHHTAPLEFNLYLEDQLPLDQGQND